MRRFGRKRHFVPSAEEKEAFKAAMRELEAYVKAEGISASAGYDSFYFEVDDRSYRVSNHSVEASNRNRCDKCQREHGGAPCSEVKHCYVFHKGGRDKAVRYIHAGKTRLVGIHKALKAGFKLDGRGNIIVEPCAWCGKEGGGQFKCPHIEGPRNMLCETCRAKYDEAIAFALTPLKDIEAQREAEAATRQERGEGL